jgi:hypothetical protein
MDTNRCLVITSSYIALGWRQGRWRPSIPSMRGRVGKIRQFVWCTISQVSILHRMSSMLAYRQYDHSTYILAVHVGIFRCVYHLKRYVGP